MEFPKEFTIWWYGDKASPRKIWIRKKYHTMEPWTTIGLWILHFAAYSILGWCYEVVLEFVARQKLVNRGFLMGPYCPIYGFGAVLVLLLFGDTSMNPVALFLASAAVCTALEYFTSYWMERLFHARWWDYSKKHFQINGRVCLEGFLAFGAMSVILVYWVDPALTNLFSHLPELGVIVVAAVFTGWFAFDVIRSILSALHLSQKLKRLQKNWEENISKFQKRVTSGKKILAEKSFGEGRLVKAFPTFTSQKHSQGVEQLKEHWQKLHAERKTKTKL